MACSEMTLDEYMTTNKGWARVGNGKKLHWFNDAGRALCGVGPRRMCIEPWYENQKCEHCHRALEAVDRETS